MSLAVSTFAICSALLAFSAEYAAALQDSGSHAETRGQQRQRQHDRPERLVGEWMSVHPVDTWLGSAEIKVNFRDEGGVRVVAWSTLPFVGKVKTTSGPYEVYDHTINSPAIHNGTTVTYWFEGETLVIQYEDGETIRFHRINEEP